MVLKSQFRHKIVNLLFSKLIVNNTFLGAQMHATTADKDANDRAALRKV